MQTIVLPLDTTSTIAARHHVSNFDLTRTNPHKPSFFLGSTAVFETLTEGESLQIPFLGISFSPAPNTAIYTPPGSCPAGMIANPNTNQPYHPAACICPVGTKHNPDYTAANGQRACLPFSAADAASSQAAYAQAENQASQAAQNAAAPCSPPAGGCPTGTSWTSMNCDCEPPCDGVWNSAQKICQPWAKTPCLYVTCAPGEIPNPQASSDPNQPCCLQAPPGSSTGVLIAGAVALAALFGLFYAVSQTSPHPSSPSQNEPLP